MKQSVIKIGIISLCICTVLFLTVYSIMDNWTVSSEVRYGDLSSIVSMGYANTIDKSSYYIVKSEEDLINITNTIYFDYVSQIEYRYSVIDYLLNHVGDPVYAERVSVCVDISTGKEAKQINHTKILKDRGVLWSEMQVYCVENEGSHYLIDEYSNHKKHSEEYGYVAYNIDKNTITEKVVYNNYEDIGVGSFDKYIKPATLMNSNIVKNQGLLLLKEFLVANGLEYVKETLSIRSGTYGIPLTLKVSDLPKNNSGLYEEFPYLFKAKNDSSMQDYYVILVFPYSMNADEVVRMITEEGHEVSYDGVFVSEDYSIDGQKHYVNNFEEYMQYLKVEE